MNTLRRLISEVRTLTSEKKISDSLLMRYIFIQYRRHKETDQQLCKAREEMKFLSESYLTYLESQRKFKEIQSHYHGKGELTVQATADLVGFKLPHDHQKTD